MDLSPPHSPTNTGAKFASVEAFETWLAQSAPNSASSASSVGSEGSVSDVIIGHLDRFARRHTDHQGRGKYDQSNQCGDFESMLSSEILDALDDENRVSEDGRRRDEAADHQKTPLENKSRMSNQVVERTAARAEAGRVQKLQAGLGEQGARKQESEGFLMLLKEAEEMVTNEQEVTERAAEEEIREMLLEDVFEAFGPDNSGTLDWRKLLQLGNAQIDLKRHGFEWTNKRNQVLVESLVKNKEERVSQQDFVCVFSKNIPLELDGFVELTREFEAIGTAHDNCQ